MSGELRYAAGGVRNYHDYPVPIHARLVWEIQYVSGPARPSFLLGGAEEGMEYRVPAENDPSGEGLADGPPEGAALWVFDPLTPHGWSSSGRSVSEVAVFHMDGVDETVSRILSGRQWIVLRWQHDPFLDRAARWLRAEATELALPSLHGGHDGGPEELRAATVGRLVAAMVAYCSGNRPGPDDRVPPRDEIQLYRLKRAEAWFEAHMHDGVDAAGTARAVGTSVRHLTRLAREHRDLSFGRLLHRRRMGRAVWMLRRGDQSVLEIASACGYRNQSAFARAVHRHFGKTPLELRDEVRLHAGDSPSATPRR